MADEETEREQKKEEKMMILLRAIGIRGGMREPGGGKGMQIANVRPRGKREWDRKRWRIRQGKLYIKGGKRLIGVSDKGQEEDQKKGNTSRTEETEVFPAKVGHATYILGSRKEAAAHRGKR